MASRTAAQLITAAMAVVVVGALLPATALGDTYVVGDDDGWKLGVDYNKWANGVTLYVNDNLRFNYTTGGSFPHNLVYWLDKTNYDACTVSSNAATLTSGYDLVPLHFTGWNYYISSLNSDCQSGMKLAVNVAERPGSDDGDDDGDDGDDDKDDDGDDGAR